MSENIQKKFSLSPIRCEFVDNHKSYGYKDKSSMVQAALFRMKENLELERLKRSAELYTEIYENDPELQELTESAIEDWPE